METASHDKPGLIGLVPVKGELGKLVHTAQWLNSHPLREWFDHENYPRLEHAFLCIGGGQLIESELTGARIRPVSEYPAHEIYWCHGIHGKLQPGQDEAVATAARNLEGTPYSVIDYAALILHRFHISAPKLRDYIAGTHHEICSQLVDTAHAIAGLPLFDGRWSGYVTPYDLYELDQSIRYPDSSPTPAVPGQAPESLAQDEASGMSTDSARV